MLLTGILQGTNTDSLRNIAIWKNNENRGICNKTPL